MPSTDYNKVLQKSQGLALSYISNTMRTENEVRKKLQKYFKNAKKYYNLKPEEYLSIENEIITGFKSQKLIDDSLYAQEFLKSNAKKTNPVGHYLIQKKLLQKGISRNVIEDAINWDLVQNPYTQNELAEKVFNKKFGTYAKFSNIEQKSKITKYLMSRGFSTDVVYAVVDSNMKVK